MSQAIYPVARGDEDPFSEIDVDARAAERGLERAWGYLDETDEPRPFTQTRRREEMKKAIILGGLDLLFVNLSAPAARKVFVLVDEWDPPFEQTIRVFESRDALIRAAEKIIADDFKERAHGTDLTGPAYPARLPDDWDGTAFNYHGEGWLSYDEKEIEQ